MNIVCYTPDSIYDMHDCFFIEATKEEYEKYIKHRMSKEHQDEMEEIRESDGPDDDVETYRFFLSHLELKQHEFEMFFHPAFRAWPNSAMNQLRRLFLNKQINTLEEIRSFYIP